MSSTTGAALAFALATAVLTTTTRIGVPTALAQDGPVTRTHDENRTVIVTALPVTLSISAALAKGTSIEVRHVPENGQRPSTLPSYFERRAEALAPVLQSADAVVTIGKLWPDDPLFTAARTQNIHVVDIDATKPWSTRLEGIAVADEPEQFAPWAAGSATVETRNSDPSIYFWQSPANTARSTEIVGADLMRLIPAESTTIEANIAAHRKALIDLKREFERRLAVLPDLTVAALAAEFVYLTNDLGVFVDSYFLKQDIDWTDADVAAFTDYLRTGGIGVVIHKWEPDARIAAAIEAAGAELVVLDPIDLGIVGDDGVEPDSYEQLLRANLEVLASALERANR